MIKNKLLEIRLQMGYRFQKDFAEFLGINRSHYNRLENNIVQPDFETAFIICEKLNKKIEDVIYRVVE